MGLKKKLISFEACELLKMKKVVSILKQGKIIVFPTDTLYGILGSTFSKKTIKRIYGIKSRNTKKPLIVLISKISDLKRFGVKEIPKELKVLWPDKITVILPCKSAKFKYIHRGSNSIAFRMPNDKMLLRLLAKTGPLVAPSANPEGKLPAKNIAEAKKYFGDKIDLYVGGTKKSWRASTIIKWQSGKWRLVRHGVVPLTKIQKLFHS